MTSINPSNETSQPVQRLELEDDDERLTRMHNVLMQLDSKPASQMSHTQQPRGLDFGDRNTFSIPPPSALLSRVQAFLPEIAASNAQLELQAREDPQSIDIESVRDGEAYIQMKLGLGVYETHNSAKLASDIDMPNLPSFPSTSGSRPGSGSGSGSTSNDSSSDDTEMSTGSDSDTDSDASSIDIISAFTSAIPRPIRPLPRRSTTTPGIVVLDGGSGSASSSSQDASPLSTSRHGQM